ncbi:MAG: AraC family transcriptional regulator [bacterium]|nr:AraC family transcriptional regulator [bacterium]
MTEQTTHQYHASTLRVLRYLQQHLDEAIDLELLASIAGFSPFHYHRIFRGMVGETVMEHVRRLRLERSASRLTHSTDSITQIAFAAGYETLEAFSRAFRNMFDASPSEFRKRKQQLLFGKHPSGVHYSPDNKTLDLTPLTQKGRTMEVHVETLPPMKVAYIRYIGPYNQQETAWNQLCGWAGPKGLLGPNTKYIAVDYDDPQVTPPEKLRVDCCCTIDREVTPEGNIGIQTIGNGKYITTLHICTYEAMEETYTYLLGQWIPENGKRLRQEPSLEFYLSDPDTTKPEELQTKIYIPIE